jgi:lipoprotein-releasing system permease protein
MSRLGFETFVAARYLVAKRSQTFISVISLVSVLGVALGVAALIVVLAVMNGFGANLREKLLGLNAHMIVLTADGLLSNYRELAAQASTLPGVLGATPFLYAEAMASGPTGGVKGVVVRGIDPASASTVLSVERDLIAGDLRGLLQRAPHPGILIGKELATRLGVGLGSTVQILAPSGKRSAAGFTPKIVSFTLAGIFRSGLYEYDSTLVFVAIPQAQTLLGLEEDMVTGLELRVADIQKVETIAPQVVQALGGPPLYPRHWIEMNQSLFAALKLEKTAMAVILIMIVLVGSFSIVTTLVMMVMEKNKDIAVLMAMGATRAQIRRIFILQGGIIGLTGTSLGFALGLGLCALLSRYQFIKLPADVYYLDHLPVQIQPLDLMAIGISAMVLCLLATIHPSHQAATLNPTEALRHE